jgi:hypothetical protein
MGSANELDDVDTGRIFRAVYWPITVARVMAK